MFVVTIKVFKYSQKNSDGQQRIASKFNDNSDVI